jgi:vitamin B12 transporter
MFCKGKYFFALAVITLLLMLFQGTAMAQGGSGTGGPSDLLGQVVVTAGRTAQLLKEVSSNITVISGEDVELAAADDLSQLLRQQGFYMIDYGASSYVQIRGMHSTENTQDRARVLVLVNGRRTGVVQVNQVPLANVERIEIIRGPSAVQYGTSALGGVINVITKRGEGDTFTATVEAGFGSFGLNKSMFSFRGGYQNFDFSGSASYIERDSITPSEKVGGQRFPHTSFKEKSVMLELGYTFNDRHRFGVNFSNLVTDLEWPTIGYRDYLHSLAAGNPVNSLDQDYGMYHTEIKTFGFTYDGATEDGTFDWSVFFSKSQYRRPSRSINMAWFQDWDTNFTWQDVINWGASAGYNSGIIDVDLGVDYVRYKNQGLFDGDNVSKDLGIYMTAVIKPLGESLYISLGGRYDNFSMENRDPKLSMFGSRSKTVFNPSVGVSYLPFEWLKLRANYSEGLRMPSAFEYTGGQGYYLYYPNPDLQPEESKTFEFGFDVGYKFLSVSLTYFHTDWRNKIIGVERTGGLPGWWYINLKDSVVAGYELTANADLGEAFGLDFEIRPYISYTYLNKRINKDTERWVRNSSTLPYTPRWTLAYGVTVNHPGIDLQFNVNAAHTGDVVLTYPAIDKGSEFVALDMSIEKGLWEIGSNGQYGKLKLRVEAKNILDSKNEIYYNYPGPGRSFYVGLKYVY